MLPSVAASSWIHTSRSSAWPLRVLRSWRRRPGACSSRESFAMCLSKVFEPECRRSVTDVFDLAKQALNGLAFQGSINRSALFLRPWRAPKSAPDIWFSAPPQRSVRADCQRMGASFSSIVRSMSAVAASALLSGRFGLRNELNLRGAYTSRSPRRPCSPSLGGCFCSLSRP